MIEFAMDEVTSTKTSPSLEEEVPNGDAPLWQHVNKLEKPPSSTSKSSGNTHFKCNYCGGIFWDPILGSRLIY